MSVYNCMWTHHLIPNLFGENLFAEDLITLKIP